MDPTARDNAVVIEAVGKLRVKVVKLLLADARVDPSAQDNSAVRSIVRWKSYREDTSSILRVLLAHPRVDATSAIEEAADFALSILMEDERFGMSDNRALYEEAHPQAVARFEELVRAEREMLCCNVEHDADSDGLGGPEISHWRHHGAGETGLWKKFYRINEG